MEAAELLHALGHRTARLASRTAAGGAEAERGWQGWNLELPAELEMLANGLEDAAAGLAAGLAALPATVVVEGGAGGAVLLGQAGGRLEARLVDLHRELHHAGSRGSPPAPPPLPQAWRDQVAVALKVAGAM